jgi:hypothetical protein
MEEDHWRAGADDLDTNPATRAREKVPLFAGLYADTVPVTLLRPSVGRLAVHEVRLTHGGPPRPATPER